MDKLNRLGDTDAKLFAIATKICKRRKSGEVYDFEIASEYNRLYPDAYHKQETISKLLRNIKYSGRITGGRASEMSRKQGRMVLRTKYRIAS